MIPYNWTKEEEFKVSEILQLIAVAGFSLYVQPSVPTRQEKEVLKSAFSKMAISMLNRKLEEGK
jgi:hypothetical protein